MQNRAPPFFAVVDREWLNAQFPGKRMDRCGSREWPTKNPDLTVSTL